MKGFSLPVEYVLYEMSYVNAILYGATLPSYEGRRDKKDDGNVIKADDRRNRGKVADFLKRYE